VPRRELDLEHLERLAHLDLTAAERAVLADRLVRLLDWCEALPQTEDDGEAEAVNPEGAYLRDDQVRPSPGGTALPSGDPREIDGFVATPPPSGRCDDRG